MPAPTAPRCMTRRAVGIIMAAGHHGAIHREKYFARGEAMPVAMVLGGDPLAFFYGGMEAPYGVFELDIVGGMRGRPVKMVRGKVTGLPFPADAEIVLEGYVTPDKRHLEGPFGEWTGHYAGGATHGGGARHQGDLSPQRSRSSSACRRWARGRTRWRAIAACCARPPSSRTSPMPAFPMCSRCGATRSAARACCTASRSSSAIPATPMQVGHVAAQCGASAYASKYIIVADEDVDVTNLDHLLWAMLTRTDPKDSIQFITDSWDSPADPRALAGKAREQAT